MGLAIEHVTTDDVDEFIADLHETIDLGEPLERSIARKNLPLIKRARIACAAGAPQLATDLCLAASAAIDRALEMHRCSRKHA
jgi:hypothetical protein